MLLTAFSFPSAWKERLVAVGKIESQRLFLWSPVALSVGIAAYFAWPSEPEFPFAVGITFCLLALLCLNKAPLVLRALFLASLGFTLTIGTAYFYGTPLLDKPYGPVNLDGTVVTIEQRGTGQRLLLEDISINKLPAERTPRRITLTLGERISKRQNAGDLHPGQRLHAVAQLLPLSEPLSPNGFDFRRNGFFRGVGATGYILGKLSVIEQPLGKTSLAMLVNRLRQNLQQEIRKTLSGDEAGLAFILLTGDQTALSPEAAESMRAVGLAHLLAIAGLHVGIVAGFVFFVSRGLMACFPGFALRYPIKKIAALLAFLAAVFYALQVGLPVPTRRALLMTGLFLIGIMFDRVSISLRTVTLAALIMLLIWPYLLLHPGFQLSFAAVIGLISVHETMKRKGWRPLADYNGFIGRSARHVINLAFMSFVATLATLPASLFHFQEASLYSMLANTLAIPLTSIFLMPLCVAADILWPFGLAWIPLKILGPGIDTLLGLAKNISELPGAFYKQPTMPIEFFIIAMLGGLVFAFMVTRLRWVGLGVMVAMITATFFLPRPSVLISPDGQTVGWSEPQTPALFITTSEKKPDHFLAKYWSAIVNVREEHIFFADNPPNLNCDAMGCLGKFQNSSIVWIKDPMALPEDCAAQPALIISPMTWIAQCANGTPVLDGRALRNGGAHAVYLDGERARTESDRQAARTRPWSVGWRPPT